MSMRCLPDISVWVALSIPVHTHHDLAKAWWDEEPEAQLNFCRYTQQGLLRLITNSAVTSLFGQKPMTNHEALHRLDELMTQERIAFAEEPSGLFPQWSAFADVRSASPKLWMDAYLAAFARCGGYRLVTNDRAFKQFKGVDVLELG